MGNESFLHQDADERFLTLHDCRADQVLFDSGVLSFIFSDGIRLAPNHPDNPTGKTVRTGLARVDFPLLTGDVMDDVSLFVFSKVLRCLTIRWEWPMKKLEDALRIKDCELEFITRYDAHLERLYECSLWQERKPYHLDCQLKISVKQPIYRWNEICGESDW